MAVPERTCVACRGKGTPATLLRLVASGGHVVPDLEQRLPGRGAWLHPTTSCLDLALRRRSITRAFTAATLDVDTVRAAVAG
ncbi:MAG: YlxR family protein [Propionibacteriaceae bacterium]